MSVTVDANILVYSANVRDPAHVTARALIERLAAGPDIVHLFWPALMGYLRVVTHPGVLPRPLPVQAAIANIDALVALPHVRSPGEGDAFWALYRDGPGRTARGRTVPDAHLAALMRAHGVGTIYTRDKGFRRFDGIRVEDPFG